MQRKDRHECNDETGGVVSRLAILALIATVLATLTLTGCAQNEQTAPEPEPEKTSVWSTDDVTIDGVYVNDAYVNEEHPSLKLCYVFTTLHPQSGTYDVSSFGFYQLTVSNEDDSEGSQYESICESDRYGAWMPSYHYSRTIKEVFAGEELKILFTFEVPETELGEGHVLTFSDDRVTGLEGIEILSSDIKHAESAEAMAQTADPEGYQKQLEMRSPASEDVAAGIMSELDGYEFFASMPGLSAKCLFSGNTYTMNSLGATVTGSYEVMNGYLVLTNDVNGTQSWVPWERKDDGSLDLDLLGGMMGDYAA